MPPLEIRTVTAGRLEGENLYVIVLDRDEEIETTDYDLAAAAAQARRDGKDVEVEVEPREGRRGVLRRVKAVDRKAAEGEPAPTGTAVAKATGTTSLARRPELPQHLIVDPQELAHQMRSMGEHYNVLSPAIAVSQMAPGYGANMAIVVIDPTVTFDEKGGDKGPRSGTGPDCYWSSFLFQGDRQKRALNKQGLLKISQAAGIQWDPSHTRRLDNGRERFYWRWQYYGGVRTHDGQWQPIVGTRELDLRDGAGEALTMTADQLKQARARGNEICETKAMQRAIRALGIRQVYTVDELKKPFLIIRFSFTPDMNDPEIKKLVTERAMSGMGQLYPPPAVTSALPALEAPDDDGPEDRTSAARSGGGRPDPFAVAGPPADDPMLKRIAAVKVAGTGKRGNGTVWTRYEIIATTGEVWSTFSDSLRRDAETAKAKGWAVRIADKENEKYPDQRDLEALTLLDPSQPTLPGTEPAGGY